MRDASERRGPALSEQICNSVFIRKYLCIVVFKGPGLMKGRHRVELVLLLWQSFVCVFEEKQIIREFP